MRSMTHRPHDPPATSPRLRFRLLRAIASRLPRRDVCNGLERFYVAGPLPFDVGNWWETGAEDAPPVARLRWLRRTWYLHRITRADTDRHLHDHPWDGRGRVLAGAYAEQCASEPTRICDLFTSRDVRVISEGERTHVRPGVYHRIARLLKSYRDDPAEVWTLLRTTRIKSRDWGYLVNGVHVSHEDYHDAPTIRRRAICAKVSSCQS